MLLCILEEDEDPATKFELLIQLGRREGLHVALCVDQSCADPLAASWQLPLHSYLTTSRHRHCACSVMLVLACRARLIWVCVQGSGQGHTRGSRSEGHTSG